VVGPARVQDPHYLLVRTPIAADDPAFPSVAAGIPAANWQEREIQDWFGLVAEGHPNPRRVALHDKLAGCEPPAQEFSNRHCPSAV
jgi:Ni,Fe-hydrogenase III component G